MSLRVKREHSDEEEDGPQQRRQRTGEPTSSNGSCDTALEKMKQIVLKDLSTGDEERVSNGLESFRFVWRDIVGRFGEDGRKQTQTSFLHLGGHATVVRVMNEYPGCKAIQRDCLRIVAYASFNNDLLKTAIAHVDGMQAILRAMRTSDSDEDMQFLGLHALCNVSKKEANAKHLISLGGIGIILEKMKTFSGNVDIVRVACMIISNYCWYEELRGHLLDANVRTALAIALDDHKKKKSIKDYAGNAMKRLMEHSDSL